MSHKKSKRILRLRQESAARGGLAAEREVWIAPLKNKK